jgi:hypothetical protein
VFSVTDPIYGIPLQFLVIFVPMLNLSLSSSSSSPLLFSFGLPFNVCPCLHIVPRNLLHIVHEVPIVCSCLIPSNLDAHCHMLCSPFTFDSNTKSPSAMHRSDILCTLR